MKLLLHCCCAPCSVSCINDLRSEGIDPRLLWYNPNIHPYTEYKLRRDCLTEFVKDKNLKLLRIDDYGLRSFLGNVSSDLHNRCEKCYSVRLEKTASLAVQEGFNAFTTTLLISPYQDHEAIKRIGEETAEKYSVKFFYKDFRPLFRESQSAARSNEMYIQKYCGCIFSEEERYLKIVNDNHSNNVTTHSMFERLTLLTGDDVMRKLARTKVLIFGAGGVGSWAAEALVRSGIGKIGIIDNDIICASNINRQIEATTLTVGLPKASALKKRLLEINPDCEVTAWDELFCLENARRFGIETADYVIDAIDTLNHKLDLIITVRDADVTLFSSMGMALRIDPSCIKTAPVWKTEGCPLARLVRQGLRKRGFTGTFNTVYSDEIPSRDENLSRRDHGSPPAPGQKLVNGSMVTVTASAGLMLASLVLRDLINVNNVTNKDNNL